MEARQIVAYALLLLLIAGAVKTFCYIRDHSPAGKFRREMAERRARSAEAKNNSA